MKDGDRDGDECAPRGEEEMGKKKKTLKEEKTKLKYSLFDLLKANDANKGKMRKI
jgi:hypothetical protein